ncbi:hypothetical protein GPALN_007846 [Globodera pallida]|nr:hypothetical protein GPALN_007846 [Globodera pallida]
MPLTISVLNRTTKMTHSPCGHQQYCSQAVCANKPEWTGSEWFKVWQCYETDNSEKCSKEMQNALIKGEFAKATCFCMFGEKGKDNTTNDLQFPREIKQQKERTNAPPEEIITERTKAPPEGIITERTKAPPEGIITERTKAPPEEIITETTKATPWGILTFGRLNFTSNLSIRHTLSTLCAVLMHFGVNCKFGLAFSNNTNKIESDKSCAHDTSEHCFASICAKEPKWAGSSKWLKEWGFVRSNDAEQCAVTAKQIAADVWKDALNYCICVVGERGAPNSNAEVTFPEELPEVSRGIRAVWPSPFVVLMILIVFFK